MQKCRVDGKTGAFRWSSDQSDTDLNVDNIRTVRAKLASEKIVK